MTKVAVPVFRAVPDAVALMLVVVAAPPDTTNVVAAPRTVSLVGVIAVIALAVVGVPRAEITLAVPLAPIAVPEAVA